LNLPLFLPPLVSNQGFLIGWPTASTCGDGVQINPQTTITSYPPMLADEDFGSLGYGDPFDGSWARVFSLCQTASVQIPVPGGGSAATFLFEDGVNTAIPTSAVSPLALPVANPTINGTSFFTANTIAPSGVTVNWSAPAGASPYAYKLSVFMWETRPDGSQGYGGIGAWYTGKTSMAVPTLLAGQTSMAGRTWKPVRTVRRYLPRWPVLFLLRSPPRQHRRRKGEAVVEVESYPPP
jgi:hypothetical protein